MPEPVPSERRGASRAARLEPAERELYEWVLSSFAGGARPTLAALADEAERLGLDPGRAAARLADEDLAHADPGSGEIVVAYPFSGRPTSHRVRIDGGGDVFAMCAVDALGIPFLLQAPAETVSLDPLTGEEVWVRVVPGEGAWWEPQQSVVVWGADGSAGPSARACCAFVHFFASRESAEQYLAERATLQAEVLPLAEAIETGRAIFEGAVGARS